MPLFGGSAQLAKYAMDDDNNPSPAPIQPMNRKEVMAYLGISKSMLHYLERFREDFPALQKYGRSFVFDRAEIEAWSNR